jgi:hypothetical protein
MKTEHVFVFFAGPLAASGVVIITLGILIAYILGAFLQVNALKTTFYPFVEKHKYLNFYIKCAYKR